MKDWINAQLQKAFGVLAGTALVLILLRIAISMIAPVLPYVFLLVGTLTMVLGFVIWLRSRRDRW
ncbi:MAG: hypothetical protein ACYC33_06975 [Thermoleophilia bacterium]